MEGEGEIETKTEDKPANGVSAAPATEAKSQPAAKPWIAAGFASRSAWRAFKGQKTGATKKTKKKPAKKAAQKAPAASKPKPKAKKPVKRKAKAKKVVKAAAKGKAKKKPAKKSKKKYLTAKQINALAKVKDKKRKKPSAPKKGSVHDASLKPVPLAKCSANVKKVFLAVKPGKTALLAEIEKKAFPNVPHKKASSRVRNQIRFLRVHGMFRLLPRTRKGEGRYKRVA